MKIIILVTEVNFYEKLKNVEISYLFDGYLRFHIDEEHVSK